MRGHHDLIEMRRKGFIPAYGVEVETDAKSSGWPEQWPQLHAWIGVHSPMAYVHIGPDERLGLLDLRWAVGLEVRVEGTDSSRVGEVVEAITQAGAARVIGIVFALRSGGETEAREIIDSGGVLTWRAS